MAKLELPMLAKASVTLLLLLCLFFVIVGVSTTYWGVLTIDYMNLPVTSQEFYYLGVWLPLDQTTLGYLNAHQRAAKAFAVFSLIGSTAIIVLFIGMAFVPRSWLPVKVDFYLPMTTLIATAVTCCVQLIFWSLMAGLYNRWHRALEAYAASSVATTQTYSMLSFSFALVLMANIGQLASLVAIFAIIRLEMDPKSSLSGGRRAAGSREAAAAATAAVQPPVAQTRIDQQAAAAAATPGNSGNVRFHRTRPTPLPQLHSESTVPTSSIDSSIPMPIRVIRSSASPPLVMTVAITTEIDAEVSSICIDNHSLENEEMLERLHQMTAAAGSSSVVTPAFVEAAVDCGPAADEV